MRNLIFFALLIALVLCSSVAFIFATAKGANNVMQRAVISLPEYSNQSVAVYETKPNTLILVLEGLCFNNTEEKK